MAITCHSSQGNKCDAGLVMRRHHVYGCLAELGL